MRIDYLERFDRAFAGLQPFVQQQTRRSIGTFLDSLKQGTRPQGIGLRRLQGTIWEIRAGLFLRVLFELRRDWITFIFVGTHDEVKRFLRSVR